MLNAAGVAAKLSQVTDNNDIDREVTAYKPTDVIIEALWVVPEKFDILQNLHPTVKWIVRLHSDLPFLATEGIAMQWIFGYLARGVAVASNSEKLYGDLRAIAGGGIIYLPNFYPVHGHHVGHPGDRINIGCFGALRPLKNQLVQAVAAVRFADNLGRPLHFHINGSRCEHGGESVLRNLRALFKNTHHRLVEHPWLEHRTFKELLAEMDIAMAVSMSETFCITAADAVAVNTPLVCSGEIPWASTFSIARPTDVDDILHKLHGSGSPFGGIVARINRHNLKKYSDKSRAIWLSESP
jgi:hypothetical protein